jgi:hypothetical protein
MQVWHEQQMIESHTLAYLYALKNKHAVKQQQLVIMPSIISLYLLKTRHTIAQIPSGSLKSNLPALLRTEKDALL